MRKKRLRVGKLFIPITTRVFPPQGHAMEDMEIAPDHAALVYVPSPITGQLHTRHWIIEPINKEKHVIARAIVADEEFMGRIPIHILNLSTEPLKIQKGEPLVSLSPLVEVVNAAVEDEKVSEEDKKAEDAKLTKEIEEAVKKASLNDEQKEKLQDFLLKHVDVFRESKVLGQAKVLPHTITTSTNRPIAHRAYRHSQTENQEINRQVGGMLQKKIIRPSTSPWSSPVVLARKKDGTWRFCVDYRELNAIALRDMYPLPRIDDALDALAGAKFFTTLDA